MAHFHALRGLFIEVCGCLFPDPTGFLALLALAIYTGVTVTFFGKRFMDWRFSWSYITGWVAIILSFAAGETNRYTFQIGYESHACITCSILFIAKLYIFPRIPLSVDILYKIRSLI